MSEADSEHHQETYLSGTAPGTRQTNRPRLSKPALSSPHADRVATTVNPINNGMPQRGPAPREVQPSSEQSGTAIELSGGVRPQGRRKSTKPSAPQRKKDLSSKKKHTSTKVTLLNIFNPKLIFESYTFQWSRWGSHYETGSGLLDNITNSQSNVSIISALLLAVWLSVLMSGSGDHDDYSIETTLIAAFSIIALTFQLFSMFNSAIILLLINELGDDGEALRFSRKIGNATIVPMIMFVLGASSGGLAFLVYIYQQYNPYITAFAALFFSLVGGVFNTTYFQYNVLSLKNTLEEPAVAANLDYSGLETYWQLYEKDLDNEEYIDIDDFREDTLKKYWEDNPDEIPPDLQSFTFTTVTERRIKKFFEKKIGLIDKDLMEKSKSKD